MDNKTPDWLLWAQRVRAIAQTGAAYSQDPFDQQRYAELTGIAHNMLAHLVATPPAQVAALFATDKGYPTPKIDVRAGVFRDGKVLLVCERSDNCWTLPGGWADENEPPSAGVEREVVEESGYQVRCGRLVALKDRNLHPYTRQRLTHTYKLFFLCELTGGEAQTSIETSGSDFFALDQLPDLSLSRTLPADIHLLWQAYCDPTLPLYCD